MKMLSKATKKKVEKFLRENECATNMIWGEDSCTTIDAEGKAGEVDEWGVKKLAYPINKKPEGYYVVMQFEAEPTLPKELDRRLRISDFVMRHLIVNKDEDN